MLTGCFTGEEISKEAGNNRFVGSNSHRGMLGSLKESWKREEA
jgi:hypothetical protein